ncbi:19677_t:CDS:2 [Entrophospora sp. SA101]|nr:19677_t:CDS:2 [Entrophospora sp. SA101]
MNVENHNDCVVMYNDDRPIPTLPNELTALVFESLEQSIKIKIARVSKVWNAFIYSPIFWKKVILYDASKFQTGTFERLKLVEELDARGSNLTDAFIKTLVTGSAGTTLKVLDISVNKITNVSILFIGLHCCNLMKIFIEGCPEVTDIRPLKLLLNDNWQSECAVIKNISKPRCRDFRAFNNNLCAVHLGLRAKMYAFEIENRQITKKAKGIPKNVVKEELSIDILRVENHNIYLTKSTKKVLCPLDTKKWILDDRINSYAYGHYKIQDPNDNVEEIKYSDEELCNFLELILT